MASQSTTPTETSRRTRVLLMLCLVLAMAGVLQFFLDDLGVLFPLGQQQGKTTTTSDWDGVSLNYLQHHRDDTLHTAAWSVAGPRYNNVTYAQLPYCLHGSFYGRTSNRILTLARIWSLAQTNDRPVALDAKWSRWVEKLLVNVTSTILWTDYYEDRQTPCFQTMSAETAFRIHEYQAWVPALVANDDYLQLLLPKATIRQQAESMFAHLQVGGKTNVISVHRRNFEGRCAQITEQHHVALSNCPKQASQRTCLLSQSMVQEHYYKHPKSKTTVQIWLFTDGQNTTYDDTFETRIDASTYGVVGTEEIFLTELWMMTLSAEHWGVPESTVDQVVWHWRRYTNMHPPECFPSHPPPSPNQ